MMCIGLVTTIASGHKHLSEPHGLAVCIDAQSGKQQLVVADRRNHRLRCVDLRTGNAK
jgi:hypothetical protein